MGKYFASGLLIVSTAFLQAYSYERCTTGKDFFYYCNTGYCCKIYRTWKCTGSEYSLSDCHSYSELRPTTKAPQNNIIAPVASAASGLVVVCIIVALIVYCVLKSKRKNKSEGQVIATIQSPAMMPMYNMQGPHGGQQMSPFGVQPAMMTPGNTMQGPHGGQQMSPFGVQPAMMNPVNTMQGGQENAQKKSSSTKMVKDFVGVMRAASLVAELGDN